MGNCLKDSRYGLLKMCFAAILAGLIFVNCNGGSGSDTPELPKLTIEDFSRVEGDNITSFKFLLRLTEALDEDVAIDYETVEGSATENEDYIPVNDQLVIPAGSTSQTIDVEIVTDTLYEIDESFTVIISTDSDLINITRSVGQGLIVNDDTFRDPSADGYSTPLDFTGYRRIWQDEFDGNQLDPNYWTYEVGTGSNGWGNNELQYYRRDENNTRVADGRLEIIAKKQNFNGSNYTSARIVTMDKFEFKYGRVDIRAKLPEGQGIWPALWMLGGNFSEVGWPQCGEIDIMELLGHEPDEVHGTAHWSFQGSRAQAGDSVKLQGNKTFSDEFHVFSLLWDDTGIRWLMNDMEYFRLSTTVDEMSEFHQAFFFIFNVAVGGNWPGSPDATTTFPQTMTVDYIRVFEKT